MIDSEQEEIFAEATRSVPRKVIAAVAALVVTALVLSGYMLLRRRHAQTTAQMVVGEVRQPPKALITVDEALLQGGKTILGGTVKNTSSESLDGLSVELELKRRNDAKAEMQLIALQPSQLAPQQEGQRCRGHRLSGASEEFPRQQACPGRQGGAGGVPLQRQEVRRGREVAGGGHRRTGKGGAEDAGGGAVPRRLVL